MAFTASRIGQINQANAVDAIFLKVFSGEVLAAFAENNIVRTISSGKSAQFPRVWKASAEYHTVGAQIVGDKISHDEVVISIDDMLISHAFIANIDEAKNHYDVRGMYTREIGAALANEFDTVALRCVALSAETSQTITATPPAVPADGASISLGALPVNVTGATLAAGLFSARQTLDENDVPENEVYSAFSPANYYLLAKTTDNINMDWNAAGSFADGTIIKVAGIPIYKTNHMPVVSTYASSGNDSGTGLNTAYDLTDAPLNQGLVWHKSAAATVKLLDLAVESDYLIDYQGTIMVAKYAMGHGALRPEAAVKLVIDALT